MSTSIQRAVSKGFTLIELLIVVIILAILAAIVIPQFANSTVDAKEATLDANLSAMRSAIEGYKVQHSAYPAVGPSSGGADCTNGVKGTGAAASGQAFIDQLTMASNAAGQTCSVADTTYHFGPYVRKAIPNDPVKELGSLEANIAITSVGTPIAPSVSTGGWAYDTKSGQIVMNSNALDSKGVAYSTH